MKEIILIVLLATVLVGFPAVIISAFLHDSTRGDRAMTRPALTISDSSDDLILPTGLWLIHSIERDEWAVWQAGIDRDFQLVSWTGTAYDRADPHPKSWEGFADRLNCYRLTQEQFDAALMAAQHLPAGKWVSFCERFVGLPVTNS